VTGDARERIERYTDAHPDAGVAEVLGQLGLGPEHRDLVATVLGDTGEAVTTPEESDPTTAAENQSDSTHYDTETQEGDGASSGRCGPRGDTNADNDANPGAWGHAGFTAPEADVYPPALLKREQWMGRAGDSGKLPFAPWTDRDHPDAGPDEDTRWKWGLEENYVDGATVAIAEDDPRLDGRVFLQQESDPFAFVDGDDVRDPETGAVHPGVIAILERLGVTYADVSTSGTGVHANYRGELPASVKQASFAIDDEPWGANDDVREVEIYDEKHVCVLTGAHVPGTPLEVREWNDDALKTLLDEHGQLPDRSLTDPVAARRAFDAADYEPGATSATETTDDIRDVFAALDRLDARRVAERTTVHEWNDDASTSGGKRAFVPTWGPGANGTANVVDADLWQDTGGGGYGGPVAMALVDAGEVAPESATPRVSGADWWRGVEHLRELGFDISEYEASVGADSPEPVAVLPDSESARATADGWDWTADGRAGDEHDLEARVLPAFTRDCATANGEHGDEWRERVLDWYRRGATGEAIHKNAELELGRPLPCQAHEGQQCPLAAKWAALEPDDVDVLIGHYAHGHKQKVTQGRVVVVDEFPDDAYETVLGSKLPGAVTTFLQREGGLPFEDYTDLVEHRDDARRGEALL
jgi:hypothetical protein